MGYGKHQIKPNRPPPYAKFIVIEKGRGFRIYFPLWFIMAALQRPLIMKSNNTNTVARKAGILTKTCWWQQRKVRCFIWVLLLRAACMTNPLMMNWKWSLLPVNSCWWIWYFWAINQKMCRYFCLSRNRVRMNCQPIRRCTTSCWLV